MKKSKQFLIFSALILAGGFSYFLFFATTPPPVKTGGIQGGKMEADKKPMEFEGLTVSSYTRGELQSRVKIQSMRAAPRRIMVFQVKSLNELLMFDVTAEIFQNDTEAPDLLPLGEMQKQVNGIVSIKGMGRITQAHLLKFTARYLRDGKETLHLVAEEGIVDFLKDNTVLLNASLYQPSAQRKIASARIDWDTTAKRFIIAGDYLESRGDKSFKGSGISVGTDFSVMPLPQKRSQKN